MTPTESFDLGGVLLSNGRPSVGSDCTTRRGLARWRPGTKVIVLSIGGILGVNARYWLGVWINRWTSPQFPWATVTINVTGSFLIGFLTVVLTRWMPHPNIRLMVITGFLGGYTTFSTFENDALTLWERGEGILMAANLIGSVTAGFRGRLVGDGPGSRADRARDRASCGGSPESRRRWRPNARIPLRPKAINRSPRKLTHRRRTGGNRGHERGEPVMIPPEASLLRVYSKAIEKWHGVPLYRAIVEAARQRHLAGASVFPVELGYGIAPATPRYHKRVCVLRHSDRGRDRRCGRASRGAGRGARDHGQRGPCRRQPGPRAPLYPRG